MKYSKKKFRAKIGKIRVNKQISLRKQTPELFTKKQLDTIDNLFDQWVKEPKPTAPLKANTVGIIDGISSYANCLQMLREYSGKTIELGRSHFGQLIMPDMNYAISEFVDLLNSMTEDEVVEWQAKNNYAILRAIDDLEMLVVEYEKDVFYDETYEGSDYTLKKIVKKFNDVLSLAGLSQVSEVQIINY